MEDEDFEPRKKKKGKGFWSFQRISLLVVFLLGLSIGVFVTNQYIDPSLDSSLSEDITQLQTINQELDSANDKYYSCLQTFEIDPATCKK